MLRRDLLELTHDDLVTLSNRGLLKRALKEIESGKLSYTLEESDNGDITVEWSDGTHCVLPSGKSLEDAVCSSGAQGVSRHIIRSVLVYQKDSQSSVEASDTPSMDSPFDPGSIPDSVLSGAISDSVLTRLKSDYIRDGFTIELHRSAKPTAYIHDLNITLRFLARDNIGYVHCDCDDPQPCRHVALAMWAFRDLPADRENGIIESRKTQREIPSEELTRGSTALEKWTDFGVSSLPQTAIDGMRQAEKEHRQKGLSWPAEILSDFLLEHHRYINHDSQFDKKTLGSLLGEWAIRSQAIVNNRSQIPALFIEGSKRDRETTVSQTNMMGLGCHVEIAKNGVTLSVMMQDLRSGTPVVLRKFFETPKEEKPLSFTELSESSLVKGFSIKHLSGSYLLASKGKRTPGGVFTPMRTARISAPPENYQWEKLRAPLLHESFASVSEHLALLPPASLRPRRVGESFFVVPVSKCESVSFSDISQAITATVIDRDGNKATLSHPYYSRGSSGIQALMTALLKAPDKLIYISGNIQQHSSGLMILPTALVFESENQRQAIFPWIDEFDNNEPLPFTKYTKKERTINPYQLIPEQILTTIGDLMVLGFEKIDQTVISQWKQLAHQADANGFARLAVKITEISNLLEQRLHNLQWSPESVFSQIKELAALAQFAQESDIS